MKNRIKAWFTTVTGALCLTVTFVSLWRGTMQWESGAIGILLGVAFILCPKRIEDAAAKGIKDFFKGKGLQVLLLCLLLSSCRTTSKNTGIEKEEKTEQTVISKDSFTFEQSKVFFAQKKENTDSSEEETLTKTVETYNDSGKIKQRETITHHKKKTNTKGKEESKKDSSANVSSYYSGQEQSARKEKTVLRTTKQRTCSFASAWWLVAIAITFMYFKIKK